MSDSNNDIKQILNVLINKIDSYEDKIDNIEEKTSDLAVIKHQMETFSKQFIDFQSDVRSLRNDFQNFKNIEYRVDDLIKWKNNIDQVLTVSDMANLKSKSQSNDVVLTQHTDRINTLKEEVKKELSIS